MSEPRIERRLRNRSEVYAAALDERIVAHLRTLGDWSTTSDLAHAVAVSNATIHARLRRLEAEGRVQIESQGTRGTTRVRAL